MKLPKRVSQHISETASFKLFSLKVPDNWIIRDITERDYGIDCYLEIVNDDNELTGDLALIQLKSRQSIKWTKGNYFTLTGIDISTTNYWYGFPVPVFIFLADLTNQQLFFLSAKSYIRNNFREFQKQGVFNYKIFNKYSFGKPRLAGIFRFQLDYIREKYRQQFENELLFFVSNIKHYQDFQKEHYHRDFHFPVDGSELIFFEAMHSNYFFLCVYFEIKTPIPDLAELKKRSREKFKSDIYELYEHDLTEWVEEFKKLALKIIIKIRALINDELGYWLNMHPTLVNYVINIKENGQLPHY